MKQVNNEKRSNFQCAIDATNSNAIYVVLYITNNQMPYQMHFDLQCTIQTYSIANE